MSKCVYCRIILYYLSLLFLFLVYASMVVQGLHGGALGLQAVEFESWILWLLAPAWILQIIGFIEDVVGYYRTHKRRRLKP